MKRFSTHVPRTHVVHIHVQTQTRVLVEQQYLGDDSRLEVLLAVVPSILTSLLPHVWEQDPVT